jgi:protein-arginine kinase activator protein McsA
MVVKNIDIMEMIMPFLDESKSYTQGFECGRVWAEMKTKQPFKDYPIHKSNAEQIKLVAKVLGYEISITELNETWSILNGSHEEDTFERKLLEALKNENYELAAKIRDEISQKRRD